MPVKAGIYHAFRVHGDVYLLNGDMELGVGQKRLRQPTGVFLRDDNVLVLRQCVLNGLQEMLVMIAADNGIFYMDFGCCFNSTEGEDVVDKSFGRTDAANDGGVECCTGSEIC